MSKTFLDKGFTLIEILVVIGLIAILATVVIVAINPVRQFKQGRDSQRISNINSILNAVGQRIADNKGKFDGTLSGVTCPTLPTSTTTIKSSGGIDLFSNCLVPTYIAQQLIDPSTGTSGSSYNSDYSIVQDSTSGRITVSANGEITQNLSVTR